jgi:hypothetical protein
MLQIRIRCFFTPWIRDKFFPDPGWITFLTAKTCSWNSALRIRIRDLGPGAFFTPGSGMNFFRIKDPAVMFLVRFS